ncbi:hypothetical protein CEXT_451001 [Caerostris extrusa]|uniref:Uncharacterized protein n=1 Tax=Caerostris extrusa TaxID=172846 RepID=A0AAV4QII8_CAEEX|nr:hypothetical protein CEXT_451001 [Caerostris extrusa]
MAEKNKRFGTAMLLGWYEARKNLFLKCTNFNDGRMLACPRPQLRLPARPGITQESVKRLGSAHRQAASPSSFLEAQSVPLCHQGGPGAGNKCGGHPPAGATGLESSN